jgi:hypothetical protein
MDAATRFQDLDELEVTLIRHFRRLNDDCQRIILELSENLIEQPEKLPENVILLHR